MAPNTPKLLFGTAGIAAFTPDDGNKIFSILDNYGVKTLDTAYFYQNSEETLKKYEAPAKYIIDTKAPGFRPGSLAKQSILDGNAETLTRLGVSSVDTYYFHSPDPSTPIEESLSAISQLYKEGKFKQFGLSNYKAEQVQEIYDIQKKNSDVLPTVFQGNYNAVSRHIEKDLFPLLRKLNISFNAYSPIAGGFLVKTASGLKAGEYGNRWTPNQSGVGNLYNKLYGADSLLKALDEWESIAEEEGISKAALAYRWVAYHSALDASKGDGIILGASKPSQLEESLVAIEQGPLSDRAVKRINAVWKTVEQDAPVDNYHSFAIDVQL